MHLLQPSRLSGFSVCTQFEDRVGTVWIDAGLRYTWNCSTGALHSHETTSSRPDDFGNTGVWSVIEDPARVLWTATCQGLYRQTPRRIPVGRHGRRRVRAIAYTPRCLT